MIVKKISYKLIPRADEHKVLLLNVQAERSSDLIMFGLCNIKQYQSYISNIKPKRK